MMLLKTFFNKVLRSKAGAGRWWRICPTSKRPAHTVAGKDMLCPLHKEIPKYVAEAKPFDEMPGPKIYPVIGTSYIYKPIGKYSLGDVREMQIEKYGKYGPIYREKIGPLNIVHLYDPADMKTVHMHEGKYPRRGLFDILNVFYQRTKIPEGIAAVGEEHLQFRTKTQQQLLRPDMVKRYLGLQSQVADDFIKRIATILDENKEVDDLYHELNKYACEAVSVVAFNTRLGCLSDHVPEEIQEYLDNLDVLFATFSKALVAVPWFKYFRTPMYNKFEKAMFGVRGLSAKYTEAAFNELKNAESEGKLPEENTFLMSLLAHEKMTAEESIMGTTMLFVAGVETTSKTLGSVFYLLANNPEKQEKLREEINKILPDRTAPCGETLGRMPYLEAFIKECFRMVFPAAYGTGRILDHDVVLSGYTVPARTQLIFNNNTALMLPENFPEPNLFKPERWLRKHKEFHTMDVSHAAFLNLPFGTGIKSCIGKRFALQEIRLSLVKILQNFRVEYHYEEIPIKTKYVIIKLAESPKLRFLEI